MELNDVLRKVRALVARAEHPETPPAEAESAREMADALMLKYAIEEAQIDRDRPATSRMKPGMVEVDLTPDYDMLGHVAVLAREVARHCRCKIRTYASRNKETHSWTAKVYGFESDLHYFEILYTTLRLHMVGALKPAIDPNRSLGENAYAIRNAGFNWIDIAGMYGWREVRREEGEPQYMYRNRNTNERAPWSKAIGTIKSAYLREVKNRNEKPVRIPIRGTATFRTSAAQGYTYRISHRLREVRDHRGTGAELVLNVRMEDLLEFFKKDNPDLFREYEPIPECEACKRNKSGSCRRHPKGSWTPAPFSAAGYERGVSHANSASLNPEASQSATRAIR